MTATPRWASKNQMIQDQVKSSTIKSLVTYEEQTPGLSLFNNTHNCVFLDSIGTFLNLGSELTHPSEWSPWADHEWSCPHHTLGTGPWQEGLYLPLLTSAVSVKAGVTRRHSETEECIRDVIMKNRGVKLSSWRAAEFCSNLLQHTLCSFQISLD